MAYDTATYIEDGEKKTGTVSANSSDYWQGVANRLEQQLAEQKQANADQLALSQEANAQQLEYATGLQNDNYQKLNSQLYIDRMSQERTLPQQLAAMGITGGAAETSMLGIGNNYAGNLAANERARLAAIAGLNQDAMQADYQARAQQISADAQAMQAYYNAQNAMEQARYEQQLQLAQAKAEAGDFGMAVQLGLYTQEEADRLYKIWAYENKKLVAALEGKKRSYRGYTKPTGAESEPSLVEQARQVRDQAGVTEMNRFLNEQQGNYSAMEMVAARKQLKADSTGSKSKSRSTGAQEE